MSVLNRDAMCAYSKGKKTFLLVYMEVRDIAAFVKMCCRIKSLKS